MRKSAAQGLGLLGLAAALAAPVALAQSDPAPSETSAPAAGLPYLDVAPQGAPPGEAAPPPAKPPAKLDLVKGVGGLGGSLAGNVAGAVAGGPVGAVAGGFVGNWVGQTAVGVWRHLSGHGRKETGDAADKAPRAEGSQGR
jgi:hypothetical protein